MWVELVRQGEFFAGCKLIVSGLCHLFLHVYATLPSGFRSVFTGICAYLYILVAFADGNVFLLDLHHVFLQFHSRKFQSFRQCVRRLEHDAFGWCDVNAIETVDSSILYCSLRCGNM